MTRNDVRPTCRAEGGAKVGQGGATGRPTTTPFRGVGGGAGQPHPGFEGGAADTRLHCQEPTQRSLAPAREVLNFGAAVFLPDTGLGWTAPQSLTLPRRNKASRRLFVLEEAARERYRPEKAVSIPQIVAVSVFVWIISAPDTVE